MIHVFSKQCPHCHGTRSYNGRKNDKYLLCQKCLIKLRKWNKARKGWDFPDEYMNPEWEVANDSA